MLKIIDLGLPLPLASVRNRRSLTYVGNLVAAIVTLLTGRATSDTFIVADSERVSTPQLVSRLAEALNRSARLFRFPPPYLEVAARILGRDDIGRRLLRSLEVGHQDGPSCARLARTVRYGAPPAPNSSLVPVTAAPALRSSLHWKLKAFAFKALSALPASEALHYWVQRHVTRTLPRSAEAHATISKHAEHLTKVMASCLSMPLGACSVLEFGAGRDLALALALRAHGIGRVLATDITPLAKDDLVSIAAARIRADVAPPKSIEELYELGIEYRAPLDIRRTGLADNSFDSVISSEVLEHIDPDDLPVVLSEVRS